MINNNIIKDIETYCKLNNIEDIDGLINKMLVRGFTIEKYGETPSTSQKLPEIIEKIVEKEIIKEIPFEVIREVEVIKEVEKIINVSNDMEVNNLLLKIEEMEKSHNETIDLLKKGRMEQTQVIMRLNKEKDLLKEDYEKKLKEKDEEIIEIKSNRDFYGE